jgi:hypothetical protein
MPERAIQFITRVVVVLTAGILVGAGVLALPGGWLRILLTMLLCREGLLAVGLGLLALVALIKVVALLPHAEPTPHADLHAALFPTVSMSIGLSASAWEDRDGVVER